VTTASTLAGNEFVIGGEIRVRDLDQVPEDHIRFVEALVLVRDPS
jgi:hypothetical protein